ncbi:MAG: FtsX-like permease family protein [Thermoleophilia bacterium]
MIRIAWRSLTTHKLRTILTTLAVLLGVAMISGTYVLTDQIDRGFKEIFTEAYKGTDVTVTRASSFSGGQMVSAIQGLPESTVAKVAAVDGVVEAYGYIAGSGAVTVNGKLVETRGAPTLFFGGPPSDLSATSYVQGDFPLRDGEVGIIKKLADDQKLGVGSPIGVVTEAGLRQATVSGVFTFGAESSLGGSLLLNTTLSDAQRWFGMEGRVSEVDVKAEAGTSAEALAARLRGVLPQNVDVKTGEQAVADQTKAISDTIGQFLRPALLSFGGIAVLVGAFIIFNAFTMTVAQRRREFAMLRALGASRRQVLWSLTGEALAMGVFASLLGLFAGLGVAWAVNQAFKAVGMDIPRSGLVLEPRTIVIALAVGILITLLSAVVPAVRATRVPPMAALQEGAQLPPTRLARFTPYLAAVVAGLGALLIVAGMYGPGSTTTRLAGLASGAVLVFVAVAMVSRYFVRPLAGWLGWPLERLSPVSGRLARDNSRRNPARTAATASALMVGLGVVVFVAVFAQGLKSSFVDSFDATVRGDYIVSAKNYMMLPTTAARAVEGVPAVEVVAGLDAQQAAAGASKALTPVYAVAPLPFSRVWHFDWLEGDDAVLGALGAEGAIVEEQTASGLGVKVGDRLPLTTVEGARANLEVRGIYRDPMMLNGVTLSDVGYAALFPKPALFMLVVKAAPGADQAQTQAAIEAALTDAPTAQVQTAAEYKDAIVGMVNQLLNLLYGLLAMSVIISLFGIVNTLVLAVYERTREIGLSRAIGMSRRQVRATVRYESVITSIIGALMGIAVGVVFAWVVTTRFAGQGITFSVPGGQLAVFLVVAVVVGVVAAILPARRAARIDILEAIQYE